MIDARPFLDLESGQSRIQCRRNPCQTIGTDEKVAHVTHVNAQCAARWTLTEWPNLWVGFPRKSVDRSFGCRLEPGRVLLNIPDVVPWKILEQLYPKQTSMRISSPGNK